MTRAANDFDMPKATIDIVTPVSPAMRTGLRPEELFGMSLKETCEKRKFLRELTDSIRQPTPGKHGRESRQCEQRLDYACTAWYDAGRKSRPSALESFARVRHELTCVVSYLRRVIRDVQVFKESSDEREDHGECYSEP